MIPPIGGPRLGDDAALGAEGLHRALLEVGVDLDLVHRRDDVGPGEQCLQLLDHEVADAAAWCTWEDVHVSLAPGATPSPRYADPVFAERFARLVTHY